MIFSAPLRNVPSVICLNAQCKATIAALVSEGTVNEKPVYPRAIVKAALRHNAVSVILAHNHPDGTTKAYIVKYLGCLYAAIFIRLAGQLFYVL